MRSISFFIQMFNFSFLLNDREKAMKKAFRKHDRINFQIVFGHVFSGEWQIFIY